MNIGVDMGHSISGAGTGGSGYFSEVKKNREVGNVLIGMLKRAGHNVINCTIDSASSTNNQLQGIVNIANLNPLDLFVSIHFNAGGGNGTETWIYAKGGKAEGYANKINSAVVKSCGFSNRGIKVGNFKVLRDTKAPAVLVEVCFMDSKSDADKLNTTKVAEAIFEGITGVAYKAPVTTEKKTYYRVMVGSYTSRENAENKVKELKKIGIDSSLHICNN